MSRMAGTVVARDELARNQVGEMFELMCRHFDGVTRRGFEADLVDKDQVVLITDEQGSLKGFSSFSMARHPTAGHELTVIYSGDTIMDPSAWASPVLSVTWIGAVMALHRSDHPGSRLVWLLLASGYRTYRFLPVFWRRFYPTHHRPTPAAAKELMHQLAASRYGSSYDPESGVVRFASPQRLTRHLAQIPTARLEDAHVAEFIRLNPGHAAGDELVCLTEIAECNLTRAGQRMVRLANGRRPGDETRMEPS